MNEQISWDQSLVKKFSSSNHFKLLTQLRSEVKKYPLIRKHNSISAINNENKLENKSNINDTNIKNQSQYDTAIDIKENQINQSTISFNNSKNFSIYNNHDSAKESDKNIFIDEIKSNDDSTYTTFKDRLNKIDMK